MSDYNYTNVTGPKGRNTGTAAIYDSDVEVNWCGVGVVVKMKATDGTVGSTLLSPATVEQIMRTLIDGLIKRV